MHRIASVTMGLVSRGTALASATHLKQERRFKRFIIFLKKCALDKDPVLSKFSRNWQNAIMLVFVHSFRCNEHGKKTKSNLLAGTFKSTIGDVAKTSRENFRRDPTRDSNKKRFSLIPTVICGYK